jgi:AraC family transcriptional regulator of adaptative response/methylated-DNA-[protein]-cysteine methyltransferase
MNPHCTLTTPLTTASIETPLGAMVAIADEHSLYFLAFADHADASLKKLKSTPVTIATGTTNPIESIKQELHNYFAGNLAKFKTPITLLGTPFQTAAWHELQKISYGDTRSYKEIAIALEKPTAYRAVGHASGSNHLALIIPCHRVIAANGNLGGYNGGIDRKQWLLAHEKRMVLSIEKK